MQLDKIHAPSPSRQARAELSRVTLERDLASEDGVLPAGASRTIVHVYPGTPAYEVEFTAPFHTVATVRADDIAT